MSTNECVFYSEAEGGVAEISASSNPVNSFEVDWLIDHCCSILFIFCATVVSKRF
jgi:hypothetical protein